MSMWLDSEKYVDVEKIRISELIVFPGKYNIDIPATV